MRDEAAALPAKTDRARALTWGFAVLAAIGTIAFIAFSVARRNITAVEGELAFEALRVAHGFSLYVDPSMGAWEYGSPPSRYYVLYSPIWPGIVGHLAGPTLASVERIGRLVGVFSYAFIHVCPVVAAPRERRWTTALAALVAFSVYFLARNAPSACPDLLASALACFGLVRAARRGHFDPLSAAFLLAAPFVKPSCIGVLCGASIAHLLVRGPRFVRTTLAAVAIALGLVGVCMAGSSGEWLVHLVRSTGQPLFFRRFVDEFGSRALFLGLPHLVVAWMCVRRRASAIVTAPLIASVAWSAFSMAKAGSGSHYWIEPTMAALVAIAFMPAARSEAPNEWSVVAWRWAHPAFALIVLASCTVSYIDEIDRYRERREELSALELRCPKGPGEVVASTDIGIELAMNGRPLVPEWQSSYLARTGAFPVSAWRDDLREHNVRWVVLGFDPRHPAGYASDGYLSAYRNELREVLDQRFVFDGQMGDDMFIYRRRTD